MPGNNDPIFSRVGDVQWINSITAAHNTINLTAGTSYLVFTADATNGGFVAAIRFRAEPAASTVATVVRVWINNGSTLATAANSVLFGEATFTATTASAVAATNEISIPINLALPPGYRIYITVGTAPGGSGAFSAIAVGGKY
jgi:hypothetical protein